MFVFCQVSAELPDILKMSLPYPFDIMFSIIKFPAVNFILDNVGLSCYVPNNFYTQLLVMTLTPICIIVLMLGFT